MLGLAGLGHGNVTSHVHTVMMRDWGMLNLPHLSLIQVGYVVLEVLGDHQYILIGICHWQVHGGDLQ